MHISLLPQLWDFQENVLKPIMARGYTLDEAMLIAFEEFNKSR